MMSIDSKLKYLILQGTNIFNNEIYFFLFKEKNPVKVKAKKFIRKIYYFSIINDFINE